MVFVGTHFDGQWGVNDAHFADVFTITGNSDDLPNPAHKHAVQLTSQSRWGTQTRNIIGYYKHRQHRYMIDCHGISFCSGHELMLHELLLVWGYATSGEWCFILICQLHDSLGSAGWGWGGANNVGFYMHTYLDATLQDLLFHWHSSTCTHEKDSNSNAGWWFGTFLIFPYIGNKHCDFP